MALYGATAGKVGLLATEATTNQAVCAIFTEPSTALADYLFYLLINRRPEILLARYGGAQPNISQAVVRDLRLPLPPLQEQRAIAHVLRAVQRAKEAAEAVVASARQLKRSLLRHLFTYGPVPVAEADRVPLKETEVGPIPEHWTVKPLGEAVRQSQYGLSKRGEQTGTYPILRMGNLQDGKLETGNLQFVELDSEELASYRLDKDDILFNRTNSYDLVGKTCLFDREGDFVCASYLIRLKVDPARLLPRFVNAYMNAEDVQHRMRAGESRSEPIKH